MTHRDAGGDSQPSSASFDVRVRPDRRWQVQGCPLLGTYIPGALALLSVASLGGGVANTVLDSAQHARSVTVALIGLAFVSSWFAWKFIRTAWLVELRKDRLFWIATGRRLSVGHGDIIAVRGSPHDQIRQLVTRSGKIDFWGQLDDCKGLIETIRIANPAADLELWQTKPKH